MYEYGQKKRVVINHMSVSMIVLKQERKMYASHMPHSVERRKEKGSANQNSERMKENVGGRGIGGTTMTATTTTTTEDQAIRVSHKLRTVKLVAHSESRFIVMRDNSDIAVNCTRDLC